jgi:hypothetical protein
MFNSRTIFALFAFILISSCKKDAEIGEVESVSYVPISTDYVEYTIKKGQNYADQNPFRPVDFDVLNFKVKFDSTAIYRTVDPQNQFDINKLYGFADNNEHHQKFSARFGWRWSDDALRIFAYVYNEGVVSYKELATVSIGTEISCTLKTTASEYIFTVNHVTGNMPRLSKTPKAKGYMLYPYFGGTETAPHNVKIWIKHL